MLKELLFLIVSLQNWLGVYSKGCYIHIITCLLKPHHSTVLTFYVPEKCVQNALKRTFFKVILYKMNL